MEFLSTALEMAGIYFTTVVRWVFLLLSIFILARQIKSLLQARNPSEIWAYLGCPDGTSVPLTHWENLIGRSRGCDVILNLGSVSRSHATLIRDSDGVWKYSDLDSKNGSAINGKTVNGPTVLKAGDVLTIAGSDFTLYPVSLEERMSNIEKRKKRTHPVSPWPSLVALTLFQVLMVIQFSISLADDFPVQLPFAVGLLCAIMWGYVIVMRLFKRVGFEMEIIAFYLSTLSLAVTTSAYPGTVLKQAICIGLGVALFFGLCWFLRDLNRAKRIMYIMMGASILLLIANLVLGTVKYGAANWITIGGFSFQPSELVKIVFIYVGAATLDELQQKKNLTIFLLFSLFCLGCLAIMGDFGTAMIFFVTFLIISFLRSGDFSKLILIVGAAGVMGMMVLRFKPYIASRFDTWGHVWDDPTGGGYQQVQTMTSAASGGIPGLGAGEGNFSDVAAASTDLVFGLLSEEWGLITAILAVLCIITLGVFAVRSIIAGRSTYYSIAACAATSMFIFQTILNVFGSIDLLPLTGVTFPLVSSGGTSMIASWGLLSFLKAADTRQNASFAIRLDKKGEFENELEGGGLENPEDIFNSVGYDTHPGGGYQNYNQYNDQYDDFYDEPPRQQPADPYKEPLRQQPAGNKSSGRKTPSSNKRRPGKSKYSYDNDRTTMISSSGSGGRRPIKYENISDDDFFSNLDNIRPEENFAKKMDKARPKPQGRTQSRPQSQSTGKAKPQSRTQSSARPAQPKTSQARPQRTPSGRPAQPARKPQPPRPQGTRKPQPRKESEQLTLEDIFGGDKK